MVLAVGVMGGRDVLFSNRCACVCCCLCSIHEEGSGKISKPVDKIQLFLVVRSRSGRKNPLSSVCCSSLIRVRWD